MKIQFVATRKSWIAQEICPWAEKIISVEDGFMCFESVETFKQWRN